MIRVLVCLMIVGVINLFACYSDFDCGIGNSCVKKAFESNGVCMKNVDEYGTQQYNIPKLDSVGPNMNMDGDCSFDLDCPIGFKCDSTYKVCVKR